MEASNLLRHREAAQRLAISPRYLSTLVAEGRLPVVRIGKKNIRYAVADIEAFVKRSTTKTGRKRGGAEQ